MVDEPFFFLMNFNLMDWLIFFKTRLFDYMSEEEIFYKIFNKIIITELSKIIDIIRVYFYEFKLQYDPIFR